MEVVPIHYFHRTFSKSDGQGGQQAVVTKREDSPLGSSGISVSSCQLRSNHERLHETSLFRWSNLIAIAPSEQRSAVIGFYQNCKLPIQPVMRWCKSNRETWRLLPLSHLYCQLEQWNKRFILHFPSCDRPITELHDGNQMVDFLPGEHLLGDYPTNRTGQARHWAINMIPHGAINSAWGRTRFI